jgi:AcrR family transcriptional regulator
MNAAAATTRKLQTAEDRRVDVLDAAMTEFAGRGYYGTPTADIAKRAGISQAYLFRLYPTKQELFIASAARCFDSVREKMRQAAAPHAGDPEAMFEAMGIKYVELVENREMLLGQLHAYAASADPQVRDAVRAGYGRLVEAVREATGADDERLRGFFAMGLLITVTTALDMHEIDEPWARALTAHDSDS